MRVKRSIIVDGADEMFTEEAFLKALEEEAQWIAAHKEKEDALRKKQQRLEEEKRVEAMEREMQQRIMRSEQQRSTEFTRIRLKETKKSALRVTVSAADAVTDPDGGNTVSLHSLNFSQSLFCFEL